MIKILNDKGNLLYGKDTWNIIYKSNNQQDEHYD